MDRKNSPAPATLFAMNRDKNGRCLPAGGKNPGSPPLPARVVCRSIPDKSANSGTRARPFRRRENRRVYGRDSHSISANAMASDNAARNRCRWLRDIFSNHRGADGAQRKDATRSARNPLRAVIAAACQTTIRDSDARRGDVRSSISSNVSASLPALRPECLPCGNCSQFRHGNNARWSRARAVNARERQMPHC